MNAVIDRVVQYPHRYQLKNVNTGEILGTFDLEPITGTISVVGTKIDKALFDSIANDISARLVSNGGDAKDNIITYTMASDRNNIISGEKLSVSFGKIARYINDLKTVAFSGDKKDIGLGNVENTSDMDKPISTAQQQALDLKADKSDVSEVDIDLEGTGTIVSIPENTTGYGTIEKLGGKSYKSENLLVLEDVAETTTNGITYSIENGVITLNGTATYDTNVWLDLSNTIQTQNVYVYFDIKNSGSDNVYTSWIWLAETNPNYSNRFQANNGAKTLTYSLSAIDIYIAVGKSINAKIYPMLVSGTTAPTEFSQGFEGIKIDYPTNVKSVGRNLAYDTQYNNGSIPAYNWLCRGSLYLPKGTYTISLKTNNNIGTSWLYLNEKYFNSETIGGNNYFISGNAGNLITKKINVINPITLTNDIIIKITHSTTYSIGDLMINYGDTALPYTPYTEQNLPQTNIINYVSNELQTNHSWTQENASKWLGLGVGNDSNIINYANNKKAIVKYSIVDLGSLSWNYNNTSGNERFYSNAIANIKQTSSYDDVMNILTSLYTTTSFRYVINHTTNKCIAVRNDGVQIYDSSYTDVETFKTAMQGVMLIYELATPIEIDISTLETEEHFECESNGSIIHDNLANYKYSFPVSLKGQVGLNFEHDKEQQRDIDSLKKEIDLKANSSDLSNVAKSGSYNDLIDKPTIPTVDYPVTSVNGKTGAVSLSAGDVGARPNTWTPSKADVGLGNVDNTKDIDKNVASAKILKNNDVSSFTLSAGVNEGINFNDNSVYLIYNDHWVFIMRIGEKNKYFTIQSTVCYNESTSRPLWFIYDNTNGFRLSLKTTKTVNSNEYVTFYDTNETFNYKLLATDE